MAMDGQQKNRRGMIALAALIAIIAAAGGLAINARSGASDEGKRAAAAAKK